MVLMLMKKQPANTVPPTGLGPTARNAQRVVDRLHSCVLTFGGVQVYRLKVNRYRQTGKSHDKEGSQDSLAFIPNRVGSNDKDA